MLRLLSVLIVVVVAIVVVIAINLPKSEHNCGNTMDADRNLSTLS